MYTSTSQRLMRMFDLMMNHVGPQSWWPGESFNEINALMAEVGKDYCRRMIVGDVCPLEKW